MPDFDDSHDRFRDRSSRERDRSMRTDYSSDRNRYSTGSIGIKRGLPRRDDDSYHKRSRFDSASDTYEAQFNKRRESGARSMLTFKKFLETQDETISDEEAISKYNEYKLDYRKQEYEKFFQAHKDEEWFQLKYHPTYSKEHTERFMAHMQKRLDVYKEMTQEGTLGHQLKLDIANCEEIIKCMDAVVIKLEDGTDENVEAMLALPVFDESLDDLRKKQNSSALQSTANGTSADATSHNGTTKASELEESEPLKALLKVVSYKTHSLFFRNIPPKARTEELETECKNHPGFLRMCLSEPLADQNFVRRLWVTFRRDVNIKDIFWKMKIVKFADGDAQASVNRDLRRRVRTVNGNANHRPLVQNDIRQAARLIALFDYKRKLHIEASADEDEEKAASAERPKDLDALVDQSKNPTLAGVFEHFVEETNAEEEELLGVSSPASGGDVRFPLEVDATLIAYLDKLLVYLRIVHSIDYYNYCEYANEDEMPNRMGMVHVRDVPPSGDDIAKNEAGVPVLQKKVVDTYISNGDERLKSSILKYELISDYDLNKLGKKDPEQVVETFIADNCVEVSKDKWLCPLSGKKFKGPEFIRKHLLSKHEQKLDEIKADAIYYNNYISDPDRPHNPEPKAPAAPLTPGADEARRPVEERHSFGSGVYRSGGGGGGGVSWNDRTPRLSAGARFPGGRADFAPRGGEPPARGRWLDDFGTGRRDTRPLQTYRDLDAPEDVV